MMCLLSVLLWLAGLCWYTARHGSLVDLVQAGCEGYFFSGLVGWRENPDSGLALSGFEVVRIVLGACSEAALDPIGREPLFV